MCLVVASASVFPFISFLCPSLCLFLSRVEVSFCRAFIFSGRSAVTSLRVYLVEEVMHHLYHYLPIRTTQLALAMVALKEEDILPPKKTLLCFCHFQLLRELICTLVDPDLVSNARAFFTLSLSLSFHSSSSQLSGVGQVELVEF